MQVFLEIMHPSFLTLAQFGDKQQATQHVEACMQLWPPLTEQFGLDIAPPFKTSQTEFVQEQKGTWAVIRKKYDLKALPYDTVCMQCPHYHCGVAHSVTLWSVFHHEAR